MSELEKIIFKYGVIEEDAVTEAECEGLSEEVNLGDENE